VSEQISLYMDLEQIRTLVKNYTYRDLDRWDEVESLMAPDAIASNSWFEGTAREYIAIGRSNAEHPQAAELLALHDIGYPRIEVSGNRAYADADTMVYFRFPARAKELVDVTAWCRFCFFVEKRSDRWLLVYWTTLYEKSRMDVVDPRSSLADLVDLEKLDSFPPAFRHLAYVVSLGGVKIKPSAICLGSQEHTNLDEMSRRWLAGEHGILPKF
jgi:hypothetical protein